ncbi:MAG TPA: hypothetical protein VKB80_24700 [Kofleriaceae bacterium]|nr:hypothetical protein [Kofleriaceae bacterium]
MAALAAGGCGSDQPGGVSPAARAAGAPAASPGALPAARPGAAPADDGHGADVAALREWEDRRRRETDFAALPPGDGQLGPDPYQLRRLKGGAGGPAAARAVGLLRGADAVVLLDSRGRELARIAAPPAPAALAIDRAGRIWVGGTGSREIAVYRAAEDRLVPLGRVELDGAWTVRALAASGDGRWLYAADQRTGLIAALDVGGGARAGAVRAAETRPIGRCHAPIRLEPAGRWLVVDCLADHALVAHPLDARGRPTGGPALRMEQDGPMWSLAAAAAGDRAIVAAGGVEDHPLVRHEGGFGYIDSFLTLYELPREAGPGAAPRRLAAVNLSAEGVVTPKWIALEVDDGGRAVVRTAGYASAVLATLTWPALTAGAAPTIEKRRFMPGTTDWSPATGAPALAASPLFDGWIVDGGGDGGGGDRHAGDGDALSLVRVAGAGPPRSTESRVGEALFFTTLMSPWNRSDAERSRFTCETCHFEAYGDGRVHFTGRGTVHASTKPLRGLFNNRPHFSRALDHSMAQMVHAEFRVANRFNGRDPWFSLEARDFPWLSSVGGVPPTLSPVYLRRSFMAFLMDLRFEPNQAVRGRHRFSARERAGAEIFRRRCESCHSARLVTEEPASAVPFERWESLVFSPQGPIVWASAGYRKSGVEPYVHPEGTRTTSLRRLDHKYPYFTNGSAHSLADVVARAGWVGGRFFHEGAAPGGEVEHLSSDERAALVAFLELL